MPRAKGRSWTREEEAQVLALYFQLSFGKMDSRNPTVKALAKSLNRTPGSIAYKLVNFASLDPLHRARGVGGMSNTSAMDREIWDEYFGRWEALSEISVPILRPVEPEMAEFPTDDEALLATEMKRLQKVRRGQQFFRNAVLAAYDFKCCITGIVNPDLLRASHILPWATAPKERLNPQNGLCLNTLHDAAFDAGLITISPALTLIVSKRLRHEMPASTYSLMFETFENSPLKQPEKCPPMQRALAHHRECIFEKKALC
jgi:putative restriction endonuclease